MEQKKTSEQNRKEKSFSEQLVESIANKPFTAEHWQCTFYLRQSVGFDYNL